jgi:hypothetical protein
MRKKINTIYKIAIRLETEYRTNPSKGQEIVQREHGIDFVCAIDRRLDFYQMRNIYFSFCVTL